MQVEASKQRSGVLDAFVQKVYSVLSATPLRWLSLVSTLPADVLRLPLAAGEWSAADCLQHLLDTEQYVFPVRVGNFLTGKDLANFDPDAVARDGAARPPACLAADFAVLRMESLGLLLDIKAQDLARTVNHSALGQSRWRRC